MKQKKPVQGFEVVATQKYQLLTKGKQKQQFIFVWIEINFHTNELHLHVLTSFGPADLNDEDKTPTSLFLHWGVAENRKNGCPWRVPVKFCPLANHKVVHNAIQSPFRATTQLVSGQRGDLQRLTASATTLLCDSHGFVLKTLPGLRGVNLRRLQLSEHPPTVRDPAAYTSSSVSQGSDELKPHRVVRYNETSIHLSLAALQSTSFIKFVLYDLDTNAWVKPNPKMLFTFATRYTDELLKTKPKNKDGSPVAAPISFSIIGNSEEREFCVPVNEVLRYVALHRFRKSIAKMTTPPTLYQQSDIDAAKLNVDVAVWPVTATLAKTPELVLRRRPPQFIIVEIIVNLDTDSLLTPGDCPLLHWGTLPAPSLQLPPSDSRLSSNCNWEIPNLCCWPPETTIATRGVGRTGAVQSKLQRADCYGAIFRPLWRTRISYTAAEIPYALVFVITNAQHTWWLKDGSQENFVIVFSSELRSGTARHCLMGRSPSVALFTAATASNPRLIDRADDNSGTECSNFPDVAQSLGQKRIKISRSGTRLRDDPIAAGAAIALKMAQSGQIGKYQSVVCNFGDLPHINKPTIDSITFGPCKESIREQLQHLPGHQDMGENDNQSRATRRKELFSAWMGFAGKKVLISRSRYQQVYQGKHPELGSFIIEYGAAHNEKGIVILTIACKTATRLVLHWGLANVAADAKTRWGMPSKNSWPPETRPVGDCAVETPFKPSPILNLWVVELSFPAYVPPSLNAPLPELLTVKAGANVEHRRIETESDKSFFHHVDLSSALEEETNSSSEGVLNTDEEDFCDTSSLIDSIFTPNGRCSRSNEILKEMRAVRIISRAFMAWGYLGKLSHPATNMQNFTDDYNGIFFAITTPSNSAWIKHLDANDFYIPMRLVTSRILCEGSQKQLMETVLMAELYYSRWGLKERYNMFRTFLISFSYDKRDPRFWTWIYIWFHLFSFKLPEFTAPSSFCDEKDVDAAQRFEACHFFHGLSLPNLQRPSLPFQRGGSFLPWAIAEQADELILLLTSYWRNYPQHRAMIRLILKNVLFPTVAAKCLTHIKTIMARWNLNHQPFFRTWFNKLMVSCTPDDLTICAAIVRFLESGEINVFRDIISSRSLNLETLCEKFPIRGYPVYPFLEVMPSGFRPNGIVFMEVDRTTGRCLRPWRVRRTALFESEKSLTENTDVTNDSEESVSYSYSKWTLIAQMGTNKNAVSRSDLMPTSQQDGNQAPESDLIKNSKSMLKKKSPQSQNLPLYIWSYYQEKYRKTGLIPLSDAENDIWIVPFYSSSLKSQLLQEFRTFLHFLEGIFEGPNIYITPFLSQDSIPIEARKNVNAILAHPRMRSIDVFFKASKARYALLPILQYCSDNVLLRDALFVDTALNRVQQERIMGILAHFFPYSPDLCCQSTSCSNLITSKSSASISCSHTQHIAKSHNSAVFQKVAAPLEWNPECITPLRQTQLTPECELKQHNDETIIVSSTKPISDAGSYSLSSVSLCSKESDANNDTSSVDSTNLAIRGKYNLNNNEIYTNPLYLLKELLACLVGSLLAFHLEFQEMETIHNDICTLLTQPKASYAADPHGSSLDLSSVRLREKLQANATAEQVQFARGFYQTQSQKRADHLLIPPSHSLSKISTPFVIPPVAVNKKCYPPISTSAELPSLLLFPHQESVGPAGNSLTDISSLSLKSVKYEAQLSQHHRNQICAERLVTKGDAKFLSSLSSRVVAGAPDLIRKDVLPPSLVFRMAASSKSNALNFSNFNESHKLASSKMSKNLQYKEKRSPYILTNKLATIKNLRQQALGDSKVYASFLFMRSVIQRLQCVMDRILSRLLAVLDPNYQRITIADRPLVNKWLEAQQKPCNGLPHLEQMERIERTVCERLQDWCNGDLTFAYPILFETPIFPTIHLLDMMSSILDSVFHCFLSRCWRSLNCSVMRKTGVLQYATDLSGVYTRESVLLLDRVPNAAARIPQNVTAVLFPAAIIDERTQDPTTFCFTELVLSICSLSYLALDARRLNVALCCCENLVLYSQLFRARRLMQGLDVQIDIDSSHRHITLTVLMPKPLTSAKDSSVMPALLNEAEELEHVKLFRPYLTSLGVSMARAQYAENIDVTSRQLADFCGSEKNFSWFVDVADFTEQTTGFRSEGLRKLYSYFELSHNLAPTIIIPFSAFDQTLRTSENRKAADTLASYIRQYQTTGEDEHSRCQILLKCRDVVRRLLPPLDFQLEYQRVRRAASICRGTNKAAVIRRAGKKSLGHFWDNITTVWSSLYTPAALYYCQKSGVEHSKLRVSVTVQVIRGFDSSFILHSGIPVRKNGIERQRKRSHHCATFLYSENEFGRRRCDFLDQLTSDCVKQNVKDASRVLGVKTGVQGVFPFGKRSLSESVLCTQKEGFPGAGMCLEKRTWKSFRYHTHFEDLRMLSQRMVQQSSFVRESPSRCASTGPDALLYGEVYLGLHLRHNEVLDPGFLRSSESPLTFVHWIQNEKNAPHMVAGMPNAVTSSLSSSWGVDTTDDPRQHITQESQTTTRTLPLFSCNSLEFSEEAKPKVGALWAKPRNFSRIGSNPQETQLTAEQHIQVAEPSLSTTTSCLELRDVEGSPVIPSSSFSPRELHLACRQRKRILLSFPSAQIALRSRKVSLLLRGDYNIPKLEDDLPLGGLVAASTLAKRSRDLIENCSCPLIYSPSVRDRLLNQLVALQEAIATVTKFSSWRVEGMLSSRGCVTVTDFQLLPLCDNDDHYSTTSFSYRVATAMASKIKTRSSSL